MATRKTTPKKSTWKSAASDLMDAAQSLGKAVASKAEEAKADATAALARAKKSVAKSSNQARRKITTTVTQTERRIEKAAADAKKSVKQTLGKVEREARTVKAKATKKLTAAEQASARRIAKAGDAIAKEARQVKAAVTKKTSAVAKSVKSATAGAKAKAAGTRTAAAKQAAAAKRAATAAKKSAKPKVAAKKAPAKKAAKRLREVGVDAAGLTRGVAALAQPAAPSGVASGSRSSLRDPFADGQRRRQPRRFDAEQVHQPGHAVHRRPRDDEVARRLARAAELGPDAGIGRQQRRIGQRRPVRADGLGKGCGARRVDLVVLFAQGRHRYPLHVGPEAHLPAQVERHVHTQPGFVGHRVDQPREGRLARAGEVVAARPARLRQRHGRQALEARCQRHRMQAGAVDHAARMQPHRLVATHLELEAVADALQRAAAG